MKQTIDDFGVGVQVNVSYRPGDMFNHDFTGYVIEVTKEYVIVEDQDGDCWNCDPDQLTYSSNEVFLIFGIEW